MMVSCDATSVLRDRITHASIKLVIAWQGFCCPKKKTKEESESGRYGYSLITMPSSSCSAPHWAYKMTSHFCLEQSCFFNGLELLSMIFEKVCKCTLLLMNYLVIICASSLCSSLPSFQNGQEIGHSVYPSVYGILGS